MDPKEVKKVLKEAKDQIKNKDSKSAVKLIKSVLKQDKDNYLALVLLGAALQESDQHEDSPKSYKKASEVDPSQPLAWQGLVSYAEKHKKSLTSDVERDLLKAYAHLIPIENNVSKKEEFAIRLSDLAVKFQSPGDCSLPLSKLPADKELLGVRRSLVKSLLQMKDLQEPDTVVLGEALEHIIQDWKQSPSGRDYDIQEFYRQFLKFLYRRGQHKKLLHECVSMAETFKKDPYPLEWICKLWVEFVAEGKDISFLKDSMSNWITCLEALSPSASSVNMARGAMHVCHSELIKAREELNKAITSGQAPWQVYSMLADVELKFGRPIEALGLIAVARPKMKQLPHEQEYNLKQCEIEALVATQNEDHLEKAILLCEELLSSKENDLMLHLLHAQASVSLKRFEEAQKHITEIGTSCTYAARVTLLQAQILIHAGQNEQAKFVLESIASDAKEAEVWLTLAKLHENTGMQEKVLTDLMEAARCEPYYWKTFMLLGNHYKKNSTAASFDKARRCYQKALQLNPTSLEAAQYLSDVLLLLNDVEKNIQLLDMIAQTSSAKWIWLRLGLLHTEQGEVGKAITYLCNAVRSDPLDCRIWESLGDAYMVHGAWHAALKSFQKVIQISPGNIYASYQIGTVKLRMQEFEDALSAFRQLLKLSADYIPAMQGQGEAAFRWAGVLLQEQRVGCAKDRCQEAIDAFSKVLTQRRDLSCTWKLLGDTCLLCARLPPSYSIFQVQEWLVCSSANTNSTNTTTVKKMDMFLLAERMYCRAMSISQNNSHLWHDLASTNFWHAMSTPLSLMRSDMLDRALTAARRAVDLSPQNSSHWNLLGVIAATDEIKKRALAQHALIQSILLDNTSPVPWTNLGTLYFMVGNIGLANKAFSAAQRLDHDYTNCWVGQAMIAETMAHNETLDLFRHAATLEYHRESCIGYAHWVLKTLLHHENMKKTDEEDMTLRDMKNMNAVEVATDCMIWYSERHQSDPCGWNMLGLMFERKRLIRSALKAFQRGLEEALCQGAAPQLLDAIRCNLGRVLIDLQDYDKSIEILKQVTSASFASQSGLALALFKAQRFEEAYETYNTAQEWLAPNDETKSLILMAMAAMLYGFNQLEECKTLLFQSIQPKPLSAHPLLALCAIGLLHKDIAMSKIMLKELAQFRDDPQYLVHIGLLSAYTAFVQGDQKGATRALAKTLHRHPGNGALWLALAHIQMHSYPKCDPKAIGNVAQAALHLGRTSVDISKVGALVSVAQLLQADSVAAGISSQKAVHQFPNVAENWAAFIASVLPQNKSTQHSAWLCDLVSHVRRRLQPSAGGLKKWLGSYEHLLTDMSVN